jgi:polyisoprenoid-binding protein YceI
MLPVLERKDPIMISVTRLSAAAFLILSLAVPAFANQPLSSEPLTAPSGNYALDKTHASLTWRVSHLGLSNYTARFTNFDAQVVYNAEDVTKSTLSVTIDPKSVETDFPDVQREDFDAKVSSDAKYLNAGAHAEIKFVSTKIEKTGDRTATITGDLTMLGVTKPVTLNATMNAAMAKHPMMEIAVLGVSATGTVKRSEFGFTELVPFVGDDVQISIEAEFMQKK